MLFSGLGCVSTPHAPEDDDPSTTQESTILSPCSRSLSRNKELAPASPAEAPVGASPRHGLDTTPDEIFNQQEGQGGNPSNPTESVEDARNRSSSQSSGSSACRKICTEGLEEDKEKAAETASPPLTSKRSTFGFFKRSNSASSALMDLPVDNTLSAGTPPASSNRCPGLKVKKRGFPALILTPRGNSSHPATSLLPPRPLPPLPPSRSVNGTHSGSISTPNGGGKPLSSPPSLLNLMARLRRRQPATAIEETSCCSSSTSTSSSSSSIIMTPGETSSREDPTAASRSSSRRVLTVDTGPRCSSVSGPMALSTMDFHYDGSKILDYLYVGGEHIPSQDALAETFNITHIVNTTVKDYYPHHPVSRGDYCQLFLLDALSEELSETKMETAFQMIDRARAGGHACLVHCRNGMSRSTSVVIAYLMRHFKMPLLEAFNFVRERRPCTSPNPSFMRQLAAFERAWLGVSGNTLDVDHYADDRFASIRDLAVGPGRGGEEEEVVEDEEEEEEEEEEGRLAGLEVGEEDSSGGWDVGCPLSGEEGQGWAEGEGEEEVSKR